MHRVNELKDPTYQYKVDIGNFQVSPLKFFLNVFVLSIFSQQFNPVLCSPGHEGVLPGYSGILHPLSNFPGGPSLLRTQKHALLGYI